MVGAILPSPATIVLASRVGMGCRGGAAEHLGRC